MASSVSMHGQEWALEWLKGMEQGFDSAEGRVMAHEIAGALKSIIRSYRARGLKNDGDRQLNVKPSTVLRRRQFGPPLAPRNEGSRVVYLGTVPEPVVTRDEIKVSFVYPEDFQAILDILAAGKPPLQGPRPTSGVPLEARRVIAQIVAARWGRFGPGPNVPAGP